MDQELQLLNNMFENGLENYDKILNQYRLLNLMLILKNDEIFKIIDGHENYVISNKGNVYNLTTKRKLKPSKTGKENNCYFSVVLNGRCVSIHKLISDAFIPNPSNLPCVDHIDGNALNNCINNLRWVTYNQNGMNKTKPKNTSSEYKGVSYHSKAKKWQVFICLNNKNKFLGLFDSEIEAARKYDEEAILNYGEFAKLNF